MLALVTGGAGFIGSNLVDALLERGDDVVVVDDLSTGSRSNLTGALDAGARLVVADIRDVDAMSELLASERPDIVFHLAAQMDVRRSVRNAASDLVTNAGGTLNLLAAARDAEVRRFVNASTGGALYGEAPVRPTPESCAPEAEAPYGVSKHAAEGYCGVFGRLYGLSSISLRLANVYGPRQNPLGEAGVVAIFCGLAIEGGRPTIFGDGLQTRDFIHVDDVVEAILLGATAEVEGPVNVGTGIETTMLDLTRAIGAHASGPFEPEHAPERLGEVRHNALDSSRARAELGWRATTPLDVGIEQTMAWLSAQSAAG